MAPDSWSVEEKQLLVKCLDCVRYSQAAPYRKRLWEIWHLRQDVSAWVNLK